MQRNQISADDNPSDLRRVKRRRTYLSQREHFLQELSKFASDSDDNLNEDFHLSANQHLNQQGQSRGAGNFFEQAAEEEEHYYKAKHKSASPKCVGISLIKTMHAAISSSTTSRLDNAFVSKDKTETHEKEFKVVQTYSPLTTGGFFETSVEPMDIRAVKVGDVMCLLSTASGEISTSLPKESPTIRSPVYSRMESSSTCVPIVQGGGVGLRTGGSVDSSILKSPNFGKTEPFEGFGEVVTPARACMLLQRFTPEVKLTDEENTFGKKASVGMVNQLFEVTRFDCDSHTLEGLFLNGSRRVLRVHEVRLAGFIERKLHKKWKDDPTSQPVHMIEATEATNSILKTVEAPQQLNGATGVSRAVAVDTAESTGHHDKQSGICESTVSGVSPTTWWVIPNLIVRIVADNAGPWYGKKCVVRAIDKKNNKIRLINLDLWQQHQPHSPQSPLPQGAEGVVEVVGVHGLETVLPKKGESGLVVMGRQRGEIASVVTRLCDQEGNLVKLKVQCNRTGDAFELEPHELCLLARRQRCKE